MNFVFGLANCLGRYEINFWKVLLPAYSISSFKVDLLVPSSFWFALALRGYFFDQPL